MAWWETCRKTCSPVLKGLSSETNADRLEGLARLGKEKMWRKAFAAPGKCRNLREDPPCIPVQNICNG